MINECDECGSRINNDEDFMCNKCWKRNNVWGWNK